MKIPENMQTITYIIIGVVMAFTINQGLAFALSTNMPVVAVESNSMIPTFAKGDILILQGAAPGELQVGDVIVFSPPGHTTPVVHRIVALNDDGTYQTKGDANSGQLSFEKHITYDQIHGRSVMTIPFLGWVKIGATEYLAPNLPLVIIILAAIAGVYYANSQGLLDKVKPKRFHCCEPTVHVK
jgi:signal peptidase